MAGPRDRIIGCGTIRRVLYGASGTGSAERISAETVIGKGGIGIPRSQRLYNGGPAMLNQVDELSSGPGIVAETPKQGRRNRIRILLLDPSHHHAEMLRFYYNTNTLRSNELLEGRCNFLRHPFLDLEAPCVDFYKTRQF